MGSKKYSFLLIPSDNNQVKNFTFSVFSIYILSGIAILFLSISVYWGYSYFEYKMDNSRLEKLQTENKFLVDRLQEMGNIVDEAKARMDNIAEKDKNIRMVFDIPEIDPEMRQLGTGGASEPEEIPLQGKLAYNLYTLQDEIEVLLRTAEFENDSFDEILSELTNKKYVLDHTPSIIPCTGYFSRGFGMKPDPFTGRIQLHAGIDIAGNTGTPIMASADGIVEFTGWAGRYGKLIIINHGYGYRTIYGHLSKIKVRKRQSVKRYQVIGLMGSTGYSTGPHLHYEVHKNNKPQNPMKYIFKDINKLF